MKVKELIAKLQEYDGEADVVIEDEDGYDHHISKIYKYNCSNEILLGFK